MDGRQVVDSRNVDARIAMNARNRNPTCERWRRRIFGVTWLAYAGYYLTHKAFSVAKNELKKPEVMAVGMFAMGFFIFIPDSLIAGAAAIDFGTKRGAATANGGINGFGSLGQMIGVMLPGLVTYALAVGRDIWLPIFVGLGFSLSAAGLLLAPMWNRVPQESA